MEQQTAMDGLGFPETRWTQVYLAADRHNGEGAEALGKLMEKYRPAIHACMRSLNPRLSQADLEDLVSGFIAEKVVRDEILRIARKEKGRLRDLLKQAVKRHALDQWRHEHRKKRHPECGVVPLDGECEQSIPGADDPCHALDVAWARQVLEQARVRTEAHYARKNQRKWALFLDFVYDPLMKGTPRPSQADLAERYGLEKEGDVANALPGVKVQFGRNIRAVIREYQPPEGVDAEIRELMAILGNNDG